MAWVRKDGSHYEMVLTDGYISPPDIARALGDSPLKSFEERMVEKFFQANMQPRGHPAKNCSPDPMHVWVIGKDSWLNQSVARTELFRKIHEDDTDNNYRIFIAGSAWPNDCHVSNWRAYLRRMGMTKKKKHSNQRDFQECGELLLNLMFDQYREEGDAPSAVLDRFGVPYAFSGYDGLRREEQFLGRIQQ